MRTRALISAAILALLPCSLASAASLRLRVLDQTGAAFPDVLVIVKSLAGKGEMFRALTDRTGSVPERDLPTGLYRAIATCPYGLCETKIIEFLVSNTPVELELKVELSRTRGNVTVVGPPSLVKVEVLDTQGKPAPAAGVLVRDSNAEYEQWYKTNGDGEADVERLGTTITFVVLYKGGLTEETIGAAALDKLTAEGKKLVIHLK